MWDLSNATHKYLIEALSGEHAYTMLIRRYVRFIQSILKSEKLVVQHLLQEVVDKCSTLTGRNIRKVVKITGVENIRDINPNLIWENIKFCELKKEEAWRVPLIKELTNLRVNLLTLDQTNEALTNDELEDILEYVCTS